MGIFYGLLAALSWGMGDYTISRISRAHGPVPTLLYMQSAGIFAISLVLVARHDVPPTDLAVWGIAAAVNLLNVVGTVLLYRALAVGTVSIVAPLGASFAVVTAALAVLGGERPGPATLLGLAVVIGGVIVVTRAPSVPGEVASTAGAPAAIGAALAYGVFFYLLGPVTAEMGIAWPVLIGRVMTLCVALVMLLAQRCPLPAPSRRLVGTAMLATTLDTLGFLSFNSGLATAYVSVVTALASIFSAVTVLLAWALLRERLALSQWAGVGAVLLGVLLVSV